MKKYGCKQVNVNLFYRNEIIQIGARHRLLKRTVCYEQFSKAHRPRPDDARQESFHPLGGGLKKMACKFVLIRCVWPDNCLPLCYLIYSG